MIVLMGASALALAGLQASISAPSAAFSSCAKEQRAKATAAKIPADSFEAFLRDACKVQIGALESAIAAIDLKNGMAHKAAASDARATVNSYVSDPVDDYKVDAGSSAATQQAADTTAAPKVTPASQPTSPQPPKP